MKVPHDKLEIRSALPTLFWSRGLIVLSFSLVTLWVFSSMLPPRQSAAAASQMDAPEHSADFRQSEVMTYYTFLPLTMNNYPIDLGSKCMAV
jgi:hypothetical protein